MADDDPRADRERSAGHSAGEYGPSLAEWMLLSLLRDEPAHGLALTRLLAPDGSLGQIWTVPKATVYRSLQRLELLGLIRTVGERRASQPRSRSVCAITPAGRAAAEAWLSTPVEHVRDVGSELMIKLALHDRAGADSLPLVRAQIDRLLPVAAGLSDRLRTAEGVERTLLQWRHQATTATVRFLTALAASQDSPTRAGSPVPSSGYAVAMTEVTWSPGTALRMARQSRGLSQQQMAGAADVSRQAVSAIESGRTDPSLRVALALAGALGMTIEELFGRGELADPVLARPVAQTGPGARVALATVGDTFVALPLIGESAARTGFGAAGGLVPGHPGVPGAGGLPVRPISPPRPTLVVAGCDPALPLLETPLSLLDPPVAFTWWPCGSGEAIRLAAAGLVHAAGVHRAAGNPAAADVTDIPGGAEVAGFASWREGLVVRPGTAASGLGEVARLGLRLVNREPGAEARALLDLECSRLGLSPGELPGYDSQVSGHLQVAAAVAGRLADAGVSSEPAALAYGLDFTPLADERFDLVIPAKLATTLEVQGLLKVLASPWLRTQLASLPGYRPASAPARRAS